MKTKVRLAGGEYASKSEREGQVLWTGDMPLIQTMGMRMVKETDDDALVYVVSQIAVYLGDGELFQTVFVRPYPAKKEQG